MYLRKHAGGGIPMRTNITDEQTQRSFELAHVLHPQPDVALHVTVDAIDVTKLLQKERRRRLKSPKHYKAQIPDENLLQFAVFLASYIRERDQESAKPMMKPRYRPTRSDLVVRYVKHLVWKTSALNSCYVAVGLGCLLYSYNPKDILNLSFDYFDENNIRRVKMRVAREMMGRFPQLANGQRAGRHLQTEQVDNEDRLLVREALKVLSPWNTQHAAPPPPGSTILEKIFDTSSGIRDWDLKHAL